MLPDFPKLKSLQNERLRKFMKHEQDRELRFLSQVQKEILHEGRRSLLIREDGSRSTMNMKRHQSEAHSLTNTDVENLTLDGLQGLLRQATLELAAQMRKTTFEVIDRAVEEVGNVVHGKGRPTSETLLDCLKTIDISFEDNGQPSLPTFTSTPDMQKTLEDAWREIHETPSLKRRFDQILEEKREAWRAREADRKLVG